MDYIKNLLFFAMETGKLLLENGAETYRVEETITYILKSRGVETIQCFVVPTAIVVSIEHEGELYSFVNKVMDISIDLRKITRINELSRDFVSSNISVIRAKKRLEHIQSTKSYKPVARAFFGGMGAGLTTLLLGSGLIEFTASTLVSMAIITLLDYLDRYKINYFIKNILGGITASFLAILITKLLFIIGLGLKVDTAYVIIGSIMTMVPGVAITNAVRDAISGDFISGMSRTTEALIIALGIALGVGIVIKASYSILGGI